MRRENDGSALLGCIFALFLASILITPSFLVFWRTIKQSAVQSAGATNAGLVVSRMLEQVVKAYDSHRLPFPPRIHEAPFLLLANGELHPENPNGEHLGLLPGSSAVSAAVLSPVGSRRLTSCSNSGGVLMTTHCPGQDSAQVKRFEHALALAPHGAQELVGVFTSGGSCKSTAFRPARGMIADGIPASELCFARLLVPIERSFTLYVSRKGELRYLGHQGDSIIENQPIEGKIEDLHVTLRPEGNVAPLELLARFKMKGSRSHTARFVSHARRRPLWELLLND